MSFPLNNLQNTEKLISFLVQNQNNLNENELNSFLKEELEINSPDFSAVLSKN